MIPTIQYLPIETARESNQDLILEGSEIYSRRGGLKFSKTPSADHEGFDFESFDLGETCWIYVGSTAKSKRFLDQYPRERHQHQIGSDVEFGTDFA
jgi:hypothetical protein